MAQVFQDITIYPRTLGNTSISWELHPLFNEAGPYVFSVQYSHSGVAMLDGDPASDWKTVGTVTDTYQFTDPNRHIWSNADRYSYRIKLVTGSNNTYYSFIQEPFANLNYHDNIIMKEIIRKEVLLLNRYVGSCGKLFKRRTWGQLCPNNCMDFDTNEVINQNCPVCFGTGYRGGYFPGVDYKLQTTQIHKNKIERNGTGTSNVQGQQGRAVACPIPKTNDFWIDLGDDSRWRIGNVASISGMRSIPIVLELELFLLPPTDIIQTIDPDYSGMV